VAGNEDVEAKERAEVGRPPCGQQAVGGRHHEYDCKDNEKGSKRPGGERERKRNDCKDGRWGARGLATLRYDMRRGTREAPAAAAITKAQTTVQTAV